MTERNATTDPPGAVVIGGHVAALAVVRSLGALGVPVTVVTTSRFDIAHRSRWCRERYDVAGAPRLGDAVGALLRAHAERWRAHVVFPTSDPTLQALATLRDAFPSYRVAAPPLAVAERVLRRETLAADARMVGIDTPADLGALDLDVAAHGDLPFPVVVTGHDRRAFARHVGRRVVLVRDRHELTDLARRLAAAGIAARLVELVPGGDDAFYHQCVYLDREGALVADVALHTLRKSPPSLGPTCVAEPWLDDTLRERTVHLLGYAGYRGLASVEYKLDARDGAFRLIGIEARPFALLDLARRAGLDGVRLAWEELVGGTPTPSTANEWRGRWIHLQADLRGSWARGLAPRALLASYRGAKTFAVWSAADPLPFLAEWGRAARDAIGGIVTPHGVPHDIREKVSDPARDA